MAASDDAIFFGDHVADGCSWRIVDGKSYLCRRNGRIWENALITKTTRTPPDPDDPDGYNGFTDTILWVEPDAWKPLNLAPDTSPKEGMKLASVMLMSNRFGLSTPNVDQLWEDLIARCSRKSHREVLEDFGQ